MRNVVLATLGVLVLAAVVLLGVRWLGPGSEPAAALTEVPIGGPFTLTDQNGRRVSDEVFRGRLMLVYFGYTFCPDMCPLGLTTIADAIDALPPELQDQVVPVFITVDPARDTPAVLHDYVPSFPPAWSGSPAARPRSPERPAPTGSTPASPTPRPPTAAIWSTTRPSPTSWGGTAST